jgi:hypothetical protein
MRRLIFGILGLVGLCVLGLIVFVGITVIRGDKPPADLATRPWVEHQFYKDQLVIDVPWKLTEMPITDGEVVSDGRLDTSRRDGVEVVVGVSHASTTGNLDATMDFMAKLLKETPGATILSETRKEESVLGRRALVLYLSVRDHLWRKTDTRLLLFTLNNRLYQVHCNSPMGDPTGEKIWERMKKSIRYIKTTNPSSGTMERNPSLVPPAGMKRL